MAQNIVVQESKRQTSGNVGILCWSMQLACHIWRHGPRMGAMIKHMLNVVPAMKPLVLVLKYFLAQRKLNVTFKGKNSIRVKSCIRFVLVHSNFFFCSLISQVVWALFYCN